LRPLSPLDCKTPTKNFPDSDLIPLYVIFMALLSAATLVLFVRQRDIRQRYQDAVDEDRWSMVNEVGADRIRTTTFMYGSFGEAENLSAERGDDDYV